MPHRAWYVQCLATATTPTCWWLVSHRGVFPPEQGLCIPKGLVAPKIWGYPAATCQVGCAAPIACAGRAGVCVCAWANEETHRMVAWFGWEGTSKGQIGRAHV